MKIKRQTMGLFLFFLFASATLFAQATITPPVAKVRVFGVSPNMISDSIPGIDRPSNGLPNVGVGTKVYLYGGGVPSKSTEPGESGSYFKSATFSFTSKPTSSSATIITIDSLRMAFIADVEGTYVIEMTAVDDKNQSGTDQIMINAAKYVGVGGIVGTASPPECSVCHAKIADKWKQTPHATAFQRKISDPKGHFKGYCVSCHQAGSTDPNAKDDGFLALAATVGWKFPTELKADNWDSLKINYPDLAKRANIQCENCHGPGSAHIGNTADNRIAETLTGQQCMQCHDAPPYHRKPEEYANSRHAISPGMPGRAEYMNRTSDSNIYSDCARCHTTNGYIDVVFEGNTYSKAPYKDVAAVGCLACHDPHDASHEFQLRKDITEICVDCHSIRPSSYSGLHHSHQGPMLAGFGAREFPGYSYSNGSHSNIEHRCATCHMAEPTDKALRTLVGGHTFKVVYDNNTPDDEKDDVLNTAGCISCHTSGMTLKKVEESQEEIKTLLDELADLLPKKSDGRVKFPVGRDTTDMTQMEKDGAWNYYFVANDGSYGIHNHVYAKEVLESTIAEIKKVLPVQEPGSTPSEYWLGQNYPNPFWPNTTIQFALPKDDQVRIIIYDRTGREVNVLVNRRFRKGTYSVTWNGLNSNQSRVPSGVYFYTITTRSFTATKKMIYLLP